MLARIVGGLLLVGLAVTGCATGRKRPPPLETYQLGMWRATYRDYAASRQSICSGEPRWLQDEISSVNGVLARWLEKTGRSPDEVWSSDELRLLQDGAATLGPVLDTHEQNLEALSRCGFGDQRGFPMLIARGQEYAAAARERVALAPRLHEYIVARLALDLWRTERPRREAAARHRCPDRPRVGQAQLYYAWQAEDGQRRYLFCDGAQVTGRDGALEFQAPPGLSRRQLRSVKPRRYLETASGWPGAELDVPPALPASPGANG